MNPQRRREELVYGLKRTKSTDVYVCYEQVCEVIGQARTLELSGSNPGILKEALRKKSKRSLIPESKRVRSTGLILFNRVALLRELEHESASKATRPTGSKLSVDSKPKAAN
jgi:hypothetical protein